MWRPQKLPSLALSRCCHTRTDMPARRIEQVQDPIIPIVARWTRETPGTISLGQGVVHYEPPAAIWPVIRQIAPEEESADTSSLHRYGDVCGDPGLLASIEQKLVLDNSIHVQAQNAQIVFTAGSNMAFLQAMLAIADTDDEIMILSPYYFNHCMAIEIAGCRPVVVPMTSDHQMDVGAISRAVTDRTRAIVTVSPNNPTGTTYASEDLAEINRLCSRRGLIHVSDEAYEYFVYDDQSHFSPASLPAAGPHTISLFSLSKAYGLAGWRLGYAVIPDTLLNAFHKIQDTNLICPPRISQVVAQAALSAGSTWVRRQLGGLSDTRDFVLQSLEQLKPRCHFAHPTGAFYVWLQVDSQKSDLELVESLIRHHGVAVLPGSAFGMMRGCALRLSYGALPPQEIREGMQRLCTGLQALI